MKKRIALFAAFFVMAACLLPLPLGFARETEAAARTLTYSEVTAIVKDFYNQVTENKTKDAYWNKGLSSAQTKSYADAGNYKGMVTRKSCGYENDKANHSGKNGAKCNLFKGVGCVNGSNVFSPTSADSQCSGFAAFMEYVIFKTQSKSDFTIYGGNKTLPSGYEIKPGDQVRYGGHSYVIYQVTSDTAKIIECNVPSGSCKIHLGSKKLSYLRGLKFDGSKSFYISSPAVKTKDVTVTFDPQEGTCSTASKTVTPGNTYGTLPSPICYGYTFLGWFDAPYDGNEITASTTVTKTSNHTLYANWQNAHLAWDANGGELLFGDGTRDSYTIDYLYAYTDTATFADVGMFSAERKGYQFDGWYAVTGEKITFSTLVKPHLYTELVAHWTPKSYTVTLNANGGTCGTGSKTVTYGQAYGTMPVPTRKGYTFAGWWTAKTGGKKVTASTICYASGNYTLYARWTEGYTMTFNPNGGTVSPTTKVVKYGQQYGSLPTPTRAGYTFAGWWTAKTGGKQVTASTVCYASAGYTLYARWTAKKFVVTLNPNGGECATATKTVTYGQAYGTMPVPSPRTGYTFAGWYTAKTGGKKVTATTVCYATGNYTLYARWTPKTYTVTLNPNGGSCSTATKKVTYGQTYGTLPVPTRDGYVFAGWFTTQTTGGKQVFSSTVCYATGNYTLYARWWKN